MASEKRSVQITTLEAVEVGGIILPAGTYDGYVINSGIRTFSGSSNAPLSYFVELSPEEVHEFGGHPSRSSVSEEIDVTKIFNLGLAAID